MKQFQQKSILNKLFKSDGTIQDPFYKQFNLYLYLFRIFGRIPFEKSSSGEFHVRYFSQIGFYSFTIFFLQLYALYLAFLWQIRVIQKDSSFDNVISSMLVLLYFNFHYDILLHSLWEAPKFISYYESWKRYNIRFMKDLGTTVPSRLTTPIKTVVYISAVVLAGIIFFETQFLLKGLEWYLCWPIFSIVYNVTLLSSFWYFSCVMICHTMDELNNQLFKLLKGNPYRHQVSKYRFLIIRLRTLTSELGNIYGRTYVGSIFTLFLVIILSLYGVVSLVLYQGSFEKLMSIIIPLIFGLLNLFIFYDGGYKVSYKIYHETLKSILCCRFVPLRHEVNQEIELLLDTIKNMPACIEPLGLFVLNRKSFLHVFSVIVSYLVVLAQFRVTDENNSR